MSGGPLPDWPGSDDELIAAEYALGVLDGGERAPVEARIEADPAFARLVQAWDERLSALALAVEETPANAEVWSRIETRLGIAAPVRAAQPPTLWNSLALWRWLTFAAGGLAAACIALLVFSTAPIQPAATMVATIAGEGGAPLFVAMIDDSSGTLSVMALAAPADPNHDHELWIIAKDESPISLGVVPAGGMRHAALSPSDMKRARGEGTALAISLEPLGGSTNGKPTTVLGAGAIQRL